MKVIGKVKINITLKGDYKTIIGVTTYCIAIEAEQEAKKWRN